MSQMQSGVDLGRKFWGGAIFFGRVQFFGGGCRNLIIVLYVNKIYIFGGGPEIFGGVLEILGGC